MLDNFFRWLAWRMPRRLVAWCAVRVVVHASFRLPDTEMGSITGVKALKIWRAE